MGNPRIAHRRWIESGRTIQELARLVGRSPSAVGETLRGRWAAVSEDNRHAIENVFTRYGLFVEGMWEIDPERIDRRRPRPDLDTCATPLTTTPAEEEPPMLTTRESLTLEDLRHFGLTADPFEDIEIGQTWADDVRKFIERKIERAILRRTIIAIGGEVGSGKSTLLRRLQLRLDSRQVIWCAPAAIDRRRITEASLVSAMLRDLGTGDPGYSLSSEARSQRLRELLDQLNAAGTVPVLAIDEAHDLTDQALVAVKRLWDSYTTYRLLTVILLGQLTLAQRLRRSQVLRELTGRTDLYELPSLTAEEALAYVAHRFAVVREDAARVFAPDAFLGLRAGLPSYPLWINNVAVRAMRLAREMGDSLVTRDHIAHA